MAGYVNGFLQIGLDGHFYDFEHLFIKSVQHGWPTNTVTNTQKTAALNNASPLHAINVQITWNHSAWGGWNTSQAVTIPAGGQLL